MQNRNDSSEKRKMGSVIWWERDWSKSGACVGRKTKEEIEIKNKNEINETGRARDMKEVPGN